MAGKILPIALATVVGVSIGVATFDRELREQRQKRLQEEYDRDVAAASALNGQGSPPAPAKALPPPLPKQLDATREAKAEDPETGATSWSSALGLWAWSKDARGTPAPTSTAQDSEPKTIGNVKDKP